MEELLGKYFSGEVSEQEAEKVRQWRADNADNARFFFEAKSAWHAATSYEAPAGVLDSILNDHAKTIDFDQKISEEKSNSNWFRVAAVIALLVVAGVAGWFVMNSRPTTIPFDTPPMAAAVLLDDGSILSLYEGTTYEVVEMSNTQRVVRVSGKAYFDVLRDTDRPFVIYANDAMIQVLGTSFSIDTDADLGTEVMVESGRVAVSHNPEIFTGNSEEVLLVKGEMGIVKNSEESITKQRIGDDNYLAWSTGVISFKQDNLSEVAKLLKEVYGMEVEFQNQELMNCQLTAKFKKKSAKEIIQIISSTFDITHRITNDRVVFSGKGC
ncbi:MAG: FecR domain-containing protein [Cytophagales bacterium]|nr:FecR domain-containing protein [Cytophagales bacterium]